MKTHRGRRMIGMKPDQSLEQEISIREFEIGDYDELVRLWDESLLSYRPLGRDRKERIAREIGGDNAVFLVAVADGRIVGSVFGTHDGRKGWINRLAVSPAYRKRGIAGRLVAEVERHLGARGIEITACLIEGWNKVSMEVFERLGYRHHPDILYFTKRKDPEV